MMAECMVELENEDTLEDMTDAFRRTATRRSLGSKGRNPMNLQTEVQSIINDELEKLAGGDADDLRQFAEEIAIELTDAIRAGDTPAVAELRAQGRALAEIRSIRLEEQGWDTFCRILNAVVRVGVASLFSV